MGPRSDIRFTGIFRISLFCGFNTEIYIITGMLYGHSARHTPFKSRGPGFFYMWDFIHFASMHYFWVARNERNGNFKSDFEKSRTISFCCRSIEREGLQMDPHVGSCYKKKQSSLI